MMKNLSLQLKILHCFCTYFFFTTYICCLHILHALTVHAETQTPNCYILVTFPTTPIHLLLASISSFFLIKDHQRTPKTMRALCLSLVAVPFAALLCFFVFFISYIHLNPTTIIVSDKPVTSPSAQPKEFSLLIGILTRADLHSHRHFLRLLYRIQSSPIADIDVKFIFCNLIKEEQRVHLALETLLFDDILVLKNCTENMNNGKTYTYFSSLPRVLPRRYDYVMKTDDDAFVRVDELAEALRGRNRTDMYYGSVIPCASKNPFDEYMSGMGYVLSWDLVEWVSTSEIPAMNRVGPEDRMVGKWLAMGGKGRNRFSEKPAMYDYPGTNGRYCSHELIPGTVVVHRVKRWEQWLKVVRFFNLTQGIEEAL